MKQKSLLIVLCLIGFVGGGVCPTRAENGQAIVEKCFNYMRGEASVAEVDMTIYRPDWQRKMTLKAWTRGEKESFFVITAPAKDKGNGTLKKGPEMWLFNPKVNRIIKLPPSMMSQAWQGSDFSNNDLAKSDSLKLDYIHTIEQEKVQEGHKTYLIKSMPKPSAPVVWGMQKLLIRDDGIMLSQTFFDEDLEPVKQMTLSQIEMVNGRLYPMVWKMAQVDAKDEYTLIKYQHLEFTSSLPDSYFTQSNLRNPRR